MDAILVEENNKGYYYRYALTDEEFKCSFAGFIKNGMEIPSSKSASFTFRPMVHIWYKIVEIGGEEWNTFFTDMFDGLPESDIENRNAAEISWSEVGTLKNDILKTI